MQSLVLPRTPALESPRVVVEDLPQLVVAGVAADVVGVIAIATGVAVKAPIVTDVPELHHVIRCPGLGPRLDLPVLYRRAVILPLAFDLNVRLIHAPRIVG